MRRRLLAFLGAAITVVLFASARPVAGGFQATPAPSARATTAPPPAIATANAAAVMSRYCVTCHNPRTKSGGLELDVAQLTNVGVHAETLEKVVHKLRTMTMPPPGAPRPDVATYR